MKMHFGGVAVIAVVSLAAYAEENQPTTEDAMTIPSATDREIVAQMHRTRPAADVVPPLAARGAKAPHGSPRNAWRYEFYHGRWWYWGPDDHWAYYDGRRWKTLPARRQDSWMAGANQDRGAGNRSAGPRRSSIGGLSTYGGDDPFETGSATIAGGETDSPVVPGLGESLGGTPGALRSDSRLGASTLPSRIHGRSRLGNQGIGTAGGGLGVSGAGGSLSGGAGGSIGGGAGGSQFGLRSSGDAGSGVGGGSVGGTSVTGGAGAPVR